jgi:N-glycosidase YbiA
MTEIRFYGYQHPFSNMYPCRIEISGVVYRSVEHFYQSQKYVGVDTDYALEIINQPIAAFATRLGRNKEKLMRSDWQQVKVTVMKQALWAKFTQNSDLQEILLGTGQQKLIENSPYDEFWGIGKSGNGRNLMGQMLEALRARLSLLVRTRALETTATESIELV